MKKTLIIFAVLAITLSCTNKENEGKLKVVSTTGFVSHAVSRIAGDKIEIIPLMEYLQDPHTYEPSPRDMASVEKADLIFVNGFDLEEGLLKVLQNTANGKIVELSSTVDPIKPHDGEDHDGEDHDGDDHDGDDHDGDDHDGDDHDGDDHEGDNHEGDDHDDEHHHELDPHTWMSPLNVIKWIDVISASLEELNPENSSYYEENRRIYEEELQELHSTIKDKVALIDPEKRILVTDHNSFSYYAREYDFEVIGTIIPGTSTNSDTSTGALIELIDLLKEEKTSTIFLGESSGPDMKKMAENIGSELDFPIKIISLKTGSMNDTGKNSYSDYMMENTELIILGLEESR